MTIAVDWVVKHKVKKCSNVVKIGLVYILCIKIGSKGTCRLQSRKNLGFLCHPSFNVFILGSVSIDLILNALLFFKEQRC